MTSYPSLIPEQPLTRLDNLQYRLDFTTDTFAIVPLVYRTSPMSLPPHQASTSILHIRPPHQSSTSVLHINPPCRCLHVSPPRLLGFGSMEICRYIRDHLFASNSSDLRLLLSPPPFIVYPKISASFTRPSPSSLSLPRPVPPRPILTHFNWFHRTYHRPRPSPVGHPFHLCFSTSPKSTVLTRMIMIAIARQSSISQDDMDPA